MNEKNKDGDLVAVNKKTIDIESGEELKVEIFMDYGIKDGSSDIMMRRGNQFYIGYEIETLTEKTGENLLYS